MVNVVRDVVANTAIKNEVVGSKSVAIMKVTQNVKDGEKQSPNAQSGPLTFSGNSSDLQTLRAGNEVKEDTILVVSINLISNKKCYIAFHLVLGSVNFILPQDY